MTRIIPFALAVAALATAGAAQASTMVIGGGAAKECSDAALKGRSDKRSVLACTSALELENLNFRDRARTYVNRGVLQMRQKDFGAARSDFDAAGAIDPNLGEVFVNRGAAYVGEERYREGVEQIDKGLALGVKEPEKAWFNRGLANEGLGDLKAAFRDYSRAAELNPDWPAPKLELTRFSVKRP
ncbi:MAG: tetratricopeptide repeat protein [Caulobacter sp.]